MPSADAEEAAAPRGRRGGARSRGRGRRPSAGGLGPRRGSCGRARPARLRGASSEALARCAERERGTAELADWLGARASRRPRSSAAIARLARGRRAGRRAVRAALRRGQARAARLGPRADPRGACWAAGIAASTIDAALAPDGHAEQLERAPRRCSSRRGAAARPDEADARRALAFLARRGYELRARLRGDAALGPRARRRAAFRLRDACACLPDRRAGSTIGRAAVVPPEDTNDTAVRQPMRMHLEPMTFDPLADSGGGAA